MTLSWKDAEEYCIQSNGHLAKFDDPSNIPEIGYQSLENLWVPDFYRVAIVGSLVTLNVDCRISRRPFMNNSHFVYGSTENVKRLRTISLWNIVKKEIFTEAVFSKTLLSHW